MAAWPRELARSSIELSPALLQNDLVLVLLPNLHSVKSLYLVPNELPAILFLEL